MSIVLAYKPLASLSQTSDYGKRTSPITGKLENHKGLDFSAPEGTPVYAVADGIVMYSQYNSGGYGNSIAIKHEGDFFSFYAHLYSIEPAAALGNIVKAGTMIGKVGTTGSSTGNHLHFELRVSSSNDFWSATPTDPSPYIYDGTETSTEIDTVTDNQGDTPSGFTANVRYDTTGSVHSMRTAFFTAQPMRAYVNIYLGDSNNAKLLTTEGNRPNIIQSFEIDRLENVSNTAIFTLYDDTWEEIEYYLAQNWNRVHVEYGYVGTDIRAGYTFVLTTYSMSFKSTGVVLSVSGVSEAAYKNLNTITTMTGSNNPGEAIKTICRSLGMVVRDENFVTTLDVEMDNPFDLINEYPLTYITDVIVPQCRTADGSICYFSVEEEINESNNTFSYVAYLRAKVYNVSDTRVIKTYIYQKGYDSVVQSLDFDIKGVFGGTTSLYTVTGAVTHSINPTDNTSYSASEDFSTVVDQSAGTTTNTSSSQSIIVLNSAGDTPQQSANRLRYKIASAVTNQYQATMTIIGDPQIKIYDPVRIINLTDEGNLHHTSGIYLVMSIHDSISNGQFYTTLKLQRNGDISYDHGIEVINAKEYIK